MLYRLYLLSRQSGYLILLHFVVPGRRLRLLDRAAASVSLIDSKACSATIETTPRLRMSHNQTLLLLLLSAFSTSSRSLDFSISYHSKPIAIPAIYLELSGTIYLQSLSFTCVYSSFRSPAYNKEAPACLHDVCGTSTHGSIS